MKSKQLKSNVNLIQGMRKYATFELPNMLSSRKDKQELSLKTSYPLKTSIHWKKSFMCHFYMLYLARFELGY